MTSAKALMLGIASAVVCALMLGRRAFVRLTAAPRPKLERQNAYRHLPGLPPRDDAPPAYDAATAPCAGGGAPPKPEDGGACGPAPPRFALDLLAALAADRENVFVSPLSIATALKMVAAGATDGSPHAAALQAAVGDFDVAVDGVAAANALYARASIKPGFVKTLADSFGATAAPMPSSAAPVNQWVSEKTQGLIGQLVDDATVQNPLTKALLLNAVYFKGTWATTFDEKKSKEGPFATPQGSKTATFMRRVGNVAIEHARGVGTAVALPYADHGLRMVLVLPTDEGLAGARQAAALLPEHWADLRPTDDEQKIELVVPRFKLDSGVVDVLDTLMAKFGLAVIKTEDGGFLKMSDAPDLHVDAVLHRAVVEVNEEGTEAAAATAAVMMTRALQRPPRPVVFDRPFAFAIEHEPTGRVLFAGVVADPTAA